MTALALLIATLSAAVSLCCVLIGARAERQAAYNARWHAREMRDAWWTLADHDLRIARLDKQQRGHLVERN